ncbi:autotransporter outer membrane beta-barrel domain-containing protein [Brucella pituitosa]|uniref:autotransporter outer membrane beta-barrel domain-containing protein n=1 Tax=Brucella pituitosa TaxID=571256 RepID=UPI00137471F2|nr:autotransporter outer membrane beta-barrel domain-containing protein [Brucella pituitosa]
MINASEREYSRKMKWACSVSWLWLGLGIVPFTVGAGHATIICSGDVTDVSPSICNGQTADVNAGDILYIGATSSGSLMIDHLGLGVNGGMVLGRDAGSRGTIILDNGANMSTMLNRAPHDRKVIGLNGVGQLELHNGSSVDFSQLGTAVYLGGSNDNRTSGGTGKGTLIIDSGSTFETSHGIFLGTAGADGIANVGEVFVSGANSRLIMGPITALGGDDATGNKISRISVSDHATAELEAGLDLEAAGSGSIHYDVSVDTSGSLVLTGAKSILQNGTLSVSNSGILKANTFDLSRFRVVVGAESGKLPTGAGVFDVSGLSGNSDSTVIFNHNSASVDFSTTLVGALGLEVDNGKTRLLGVNDDFTGTINAFGGTLVLQDPRNLGSGTINFRGGQLEIENPDPSDTGMIFLQDMTFSSAGGTISVEGTVDASFKGVLRDFGTEAGWLIKTGDGILDLYGQNTYSGGTELIAGELAIVSDAALGDANARLRFNGGRLGSYGNHVVSQRHVTITSAGGTIFVKSGKILTLGGLVENDGNDDGALSKTGEGTLVLTQNNTYTGGTTLYAGTISVSSDANLGAASGRLNFHGGTLQISDDMATARMINLASAGGTIVVDGGKTMTASGTFQDAWFARGHLSKSGDGTLVMTAVNTYTGGTDIASGILQLGDGTSDGGIIGDIVDNASLIINNSGDTAVHGDISGTGSVTKAGTGSSKLTLYGHNSYSGGTNILAGSVSVSQDENLGDLGGKINFDGGVLQITGSDFERTDRDIAWGVHGGGFDIADANNTFSVSSVFTGTGGLIKAGPGALVLTADSSGYTGGVDVQGGDLRLDGATLGGSVTVDDQADLGGDGRIKGATTIGSGGTLFGQTGQKLYFEQGLSLAAGSQTDVTLTGGPSPHALFDVTGDLSLNGTLNVEAGSVIGAGVYRIFDYSGNLTTNTMVIGTVADGNVADFSLQTSISNEVNLVSTAGRNFFFWDGTGAPNDGVISGGNGTWNAANQNWTSFDGMTNSPWSDDTFAVFGGTAGTVTIAAGYQPGVNGMQFMTDGYVLQGGALTLAGTGDQLIIVGDGSSQAATMTATIASVIEGTEGLLKSGLGNLVLKGANTYTGTTTVTQGLLTLGDGGSLDPSSNIVLANTRYGYGSFAVDQAGNATLANQISGVGKVFKRGSGTTTFSGDNSYTGGLTVEAGSARAGIADHAFGTGNVSIKGGGTLELADYNETIGNLIGQKAGDGDIKLGSGNLTLNQDLHADYSGVISGTGGMVKNGAGDLVLYGANSYSGQTAVNAGELIQGGQGAFSQASSYSVASGAEIDLGSFATTMASLNNGGTVTFGGNGGTVLSLSGDYIGSGGTLAMSTVLGGDNSLTDQLRVSGNTSGESKIAITNRDGLGAQTINGVEIVSIGGASDGTFSLLGDYTTKDGKQAIITGSAYAYTLQKGSGTGSNDKNWYLVSSYDQDDPVNPVDPDCQKNNTCPTPPNPNPNPNPGRFSPAAPVYESYTSTLQALNRLPTLQQRVGARYLNEGPLRSTIDTAATATGETESSAIWGRIEGAHNRIESGSTAGDLHQDINTTLMQAGVDGLFLDNQQGRLIAGLVGQYGTARANIDNRTGDGSGDISTQAWGLGATATWYGNSGFYVDAQAQANWYDSDLDVDAVHRNLTNGNKGFGYALSLEAGRRIPVSQNWSLTPQAQLSWSSVDFDSFTDAYGAHISNRNGDSLTGRIGLAVNYARSFTGKDGRRVNTAVYSIANLYQELLGDARMNYAGTHLATDYDATWTGIGAGGSYAWADNKYVLYGEGSINTSLNHFADSYTLKGNLGFKMHW